MEKIKLYNFPEMDALRQIQDPLADKAVEVLIKHPDLAKEINSWNKFSVDLIQHHPRDLFSFWSFYEKPFPQMDNHKVTLAQEFFGRNGRLYLILLGYYSLPYSYAFGDGAEVLVRSRGIMENIGKRLAETAFFVLDSFRPGAFDSQKEEVLLTLAKVRLIHAYSRFFIHHHAKDWKAEWGKPINQEDLLGTNLVFSLLVIRGMRKAGFSLSEQERDALMYYWKLIGYYLGINVEYWPGTAKEAYELEKLLRCRHIRASDAGKKLIGTLIGHYEKGLENPRFAKLSKELIAFFLGKEACQALGISSSSAIPGSLLNLLLQVSLYGSGFKTNSYKQLRKGFESTTHQNYGPLRLKLPEFPPPG